MAANFDSLKEEALKLAPENLRQLRAAIDEKLEALTPPMTEDEFEEMLEKRGIITRAKNRNMVSKFDPVPIEGKPISETIIEERR